MIIYLIIGLALFSISYKIVKALDGGNKSESQNNDKYTNNKNNNSITMKDGMNLYFGKVIGKLIILGIGLLAIVLIPILISIFMTF